ncbi:hypothetical protein IW262DRAFT_1298405 [Armillaria fumosa]|nr:hypothetical protein IW262DRAFT_1298405 [Armillaria fumosa]
MYGTVPPNIMMTNNCTVDQATAQTIDKPNEQYYIEGYTSTPLLHTVSLSSLEIKSVFSDIEDQSNLSDKDAICAILTPNLSMSSASLHAPDTPPHDTPTGNLAYMLPPAAGFPEIQGWTKQETAINMSNIVKNSQESLSEPKCLLYTVNPSFSRDQITQLTDSLTNAVQGLTGNNNIILSPPVLSCGAAKNEREVKPAAAFIAANCDAISSTLSNEQAVASIINSVVVRKMDLIVTGGHKECTWAIYATSPMAMFNIHLAWCNLIGNLSFNADLATHGEGIHYLKDHCCTLCYSIDHLTPLCPYPLTTGWHGPILHTAGHNNATLTIDFDALQVLDIHCTPARETHMDRGRGIHGGGRGYRGSCGYRGNRGLNYGPY